jgi:hypothetical protein
VPTAASVSSLLITGELAELAAWKSTLVPILLYRDSATNEWVIVASTYSCDDWDRYGKPEPPYWEYRLRGGQWIRSKLSEASIGQKTNLSFDCETKLPAASISLPMKTEIRKTNSFANFYLTILADARSKCG